MSDMGFSCSLVERYEGHSQKRHDFLGFIDFISIGKNADNCDTIIGVQSTSGSHHQDHKRKMLRSKRFPLWAQGKNRKVLLLTFSKKIKPGCKKQKTWQPRAEWLTMEDWNDYQKVVEEEDKADRKSFKKLFGDDNKELEEKMFGSYEPNSVTPKKK